MNCFVLLWKQVLLLRLIFHHVHFDEDEFAERNAKSSPQENHKDLLATSQ